MVCAIPNLMMLSLEHQQISDSILPLNRRDETSVTSRTINNVPDEISTAAGLSATPWGIGRREEGEQSLLGDRR